MLIAGDTASVATSALGPIGSTTCYDLRFPELWRALVDAGAKTAVVPAAWPAARRAHWRLPTACEVDASCVDAVRAEFPVLADRRLPFTPPSTQPPHAPGGFP
ncbi:nitrilase-related carbon-nitrogen hydrolase [Saccharopolyspora rosea]|uniref:Nitrilase-related carbon-nitrogen hydrolase n=1 Tax=Saccharopolyspora rosea TaxID=524884 RepID=A0ABW3FT85_9PSEU